MAVDTGKVFEIVKQIALDELRAKGYAPNPADVVGIAKQTAELIVAEVEKAMAEVSANQPSTFPKTATEPAKVVETVKPPTP